MSEKKKEKQTDEMKEKLENEISVEETIAEERVAEETVKEEKANCSETVEDNNTAQIEKITAELAAQKEQFLRLMAEYDNFRKRSQAEKAAVYNNAISDAISAMLPVSDNFDRALSTQDASAEDLRKGMEMIYAQMNNAFEQLGVTAIGEKGEDFDPNFHNAVAHVEDDKLDEGVIAAVLQKGYMIGDKVIRHAMVQVAN